MLCEFSIAPITSGESLGKAVSEIIAIIDESGIPYQTHAFGTLVEGEWEPVMALIKKCHHAMRNHHSRVITTIRIDDREGAGRRLTGKVDSIEKHLGRQIRR